MAGCSGYSTSFAAVIIPHMSTLEAVFRHAPRIILHGFNFSSTFDQKVKDIHMIESCCKIKRTSETRTVAIDIDGFLDNQVAN